MVCMLYCVCESGDNAINLYDRHGQQIQDIPLPGYDSTHLMSTVSYILFFCAEKLIVV